MFDLQYESFGFEVAIDRTTDANKKQQLYNSYQQMRTHYYQKNQNDSSTYFNSLLFDENKEIEKTIIDKLQEEENTVSAGICPRCGSDKTITTSIQTRGGDEGITFFFICKFCQYRKKI